jgi:hypothetical protein
VHFLFLKLNWLTRSFTPWTSTWKAKSEALCNISYQDGFSLRWGVVSPSPNPQAEGPHPADCPRLLIEYVRSCPQHVEAVSSFRNPRKRHAVVTGTHTTRFHRNTQFNVYYYGSHSRRSGSNPSDARRYKTVLSTWVTCSQKDRGSSPGTVRSFTLFSWNFKPFRS